MSALKMASRKFVALVTASLALFSVACAGGGETPSYTGTDLSGPAFATSTQALKCEAGAVESCTIWLGRHGDLSNCAEGLDVCSQGSWTGCIDNDTLSEIPELFAAMGSAE
jgi:hypothetical protein